MWIKKFAFSSIGSKTLMALTGLGLSGFLVAHISGNLLLYAGPDTFNEYAHAIQSKPALLWTARSGLLLMFALHVLLGIKLSRANKSARPIKYAFQSTIQASKASRSMIYSGLTLLAFVLYHLAHFTLYLVNVTEHGQDAQGRHDAYRMVIQGFSDPLVAGAYIFAMLVLWFHLVHGFSSLWQSLGLRHPKYVTLLKYAGPAFSTLIAALFISIPVSVLMGVLKLQ